jgi:hypothetical protein
MIKKKQDKKINPFLDWLSVTVFVIFLGYVLFSQGGLLGHF